MSIACLPNPSAALIVGLAALTIALLIAAASAGNQIGNILLVVASVCFSLILVESLCLVLKSNVVETGRDALSLKDPALGWTLRPGAHRMSKTLNGRPVYDVTYHIDSQRHRVTRPVATGPAYVFVGDSVTFGEGVEDADTFPQAFSDLMKGRARVVNLGVWGYSPAQVLRELQLGLYDDVLKAAKRVVLITAAWHMDRTGCRVAFVEGAPRYVLHGDRLDLDGACATPTHSRVMSVLMGTATYAVLIAPRRGLIDRTDILTYIAIVSETAKLTQSKYGVPLDVLYLRNGGYLHFTGFDDDDIMKRLRERDVNVIDATLPNEGKAGVAIPGDGHPNGVGHRLRAKLLFDHLKQTSAGFP